HPGRANPLGDGLQQLDGYLSRLGLDRGTLVTPGRAATGTPALSCGRYATASLSTVLSATSTRRTPATSGSGSRPPRRCTRRVAPTPGRTSPSPAHPATSPAAPWPPWPWVASSTCTRPDPPAAEAATGVSGLVTRPGYHGRPPRGPVPVDRSSPDAGAID